MLHSCIPCSQVCCLEVVQPVCMCMHGDMCRPCGGTGVVLCDKDEMPRAHQSHCLLKTSMLGIGRRAMPSAARRPRTRLLVPLEWVRRRDSPASDGRTRKTLLSRRSSLEQWEVSTCGDKVLVGGRTSLILWDGRSGSLDFELAVALRYGRVCVSRGGAGFLLISRRTSPSATAEVIGVVTIQDYVIVDFGIDPDGRCIFAFSEADAGVLDVVWDMDSVPRGGAAAPRAHSLRPRRQRQYGRDGGGRRTHSRAWSAVGAGAAQAVLPDAPPAPLAYVNLGARARKRLYGLLAALVLHSRKVPGGPCMGAVRDEEVDFGLEMAALEGWLPTAVLADALHLQAPAVAASALGARHKFHGESLRTGLRTAGAWCKCGSGR